MSRNPFIDKPLAGLSGLLGGKVTQTEKNQTPAARYCISPLLLFVLLWQNSLLSATVGAHTADPLAAAPYLARAQTQKLWNHPHWHNLLFYEKRADGTYGSAANGDSLFLSPTGRTDPKAELLASVASLFLPAGENQNAHPQCRYRSRFVWLQERLAFDERLLPKVHCQEYLQWFHKIDPHSLVFVFAHYSFHSVESSFGHLFLRIDPAEEKNVPMLSFTVGFAARPPDKEEFRPSYLAKGVFGGLEGRYFIFPYYFKLQEYGNLESRDLWEYRLSFTKRETERLLNHIWELQHTAFGYYFFDENCSGRLLDLLEIARPGLTWKTKGSLWTIPTDSLKAVKEKGLIVETHYRPSAKSRIYQKLPLLDTGEQEFFFRLVEDAEILDSIAWQQFDRPAKATILDAYIEYLGLRRIGLTIDRQLPFLRRRAALEYTSRYDNLERLSTPPDEGQGSSAVRIAYGSSSNTGGYWEAVLRPAYHSFMDSDYGYFPHSEIELLNLRLRKDATDDRYWLEEFTWFSLLSLLPYDSLSRSFSTKLRVATETLPESVCDGCRIHTFRFGGGFAAELGPVLLYLLPEIAANLGNGLEGGYQAGFGVDAGLAYGWSHKAKVHLQWNYGQYLAGEKAIARKLLLQTRYSPTRNTDLFAAIGRERGVDDYQAGISYFF